MRCKDFLCTDRRERDWVKLLHREEKFHDKKMREASTKGKEGGRKCIEPLVRMQNLPEGDGPSKKGGSPQETGRGGTEKKGVKEGNSYCRDWASRGEGSVRCH